MGVLRRGMSNLGEYLSCIQVHLRPLSVFLQEDSHCFLGLYRNGIVESTKEVKLLKELLYLTGYWLGREGKIKRGEMDPLVASMDHLVMQLSLNRTEVSPTKPNESERIGFPSATTSKPSPPSSARSEGTASMSSSASSTGSVGSWSAASSENGRKPSPPSSGRSEGTASMSSSASSTGSVGSGNTVSSENGRGPSSLSPKSSISDSQRAGTIPKLPLASLRAAMVTLEEAFEVLYQLREVQIVCLEKLYRPVAWKSPWIKSTWNIEPFFSPIRETIEIAYAYRKVKDNKVFRLQEILSLIFRYVLRLSLRSFGKVGTGNCFRAYVKQNPCFFRNSDGQILEITVFTQLSRVAGYLPVELYKKEGALGRIANAFFEEDLPYFLAEEDPPIA
jgi:hypothetical protein